MVLFTRWQLTAAEIADVKTLVGPSALTRTTITIEKSYGVDTTSWGVA